MYELTSVLIAISAASASFVAILGGFIASKLISISGERNSNNERLKEIETEKTFLLDNNDKLIQELFEEDSIVFIIKHITELIEQWRLEDVYDVNIAQEIKLEDLKPFWEKAESLLTEYYLAIENEEELNQDDIPISVAKKYKEDSFAYEVCEEIAREIKRTTHSTSRFDFITNVRPPRITGKWYTENESTIKENNQKLDRLEFEEKQIKQRNKSLNSPKSMNIGFIIFAIFSLFCIVLPLVFSPFTTCNYKLFITIKIIFISVFVIGLATVFLYLLSLLGKKK